MPCSRLTLATRALVAVLLSFAKAYNVNVSATRDSEEKEILKAYRRVALKLHPDKGGDTAKFQKLQTLKEEWDIARKSNAKPGNPTLPVIVRTPSTTEPQGKRVRGIAVLLTYGGRWSLSLWKSFVAYVCRQLRSWGVSRWCATLEKSEAGKLHVHLALQFQTCVNRWSKFFAWGERFPNASSHDYLGQGLNKNPRFIQQSVDRGFFYVYAAKEGTQHDKHGNICFEGNHVPCWEKTPKATRYQVLGKWPQSLWQQYKLSADNYEHYLFLCRDGVISRKRNLDVVRARAEEEEEAEQMAAATKRVRLNTFTAFPKLPAVTKWLALFKIESDRYPFLILLGPSRSRKTEFAKALFKNPLELKIGTLGYFPDRMRDFSRLKHDAVVLDDCRDFRFLVEHQEKLQGKVDARVEFASTPGGQCKYIRDAM